MPTYDTSSSVFTLSTFECNPKSRVCCQTLLLNIIKCNFRCRPFTSHFYILWPPNQFSSSQSLFVRSASTSRVFSEQTYYLLFLWSPRWSSHLINHLALISVLVLLSLSVALCHVNCLCFFCLIFFFQTPLPSEACGRNFVFQVKRGKNNIFFILLDKPQWNRFTRTTRGLPKTFVQTFMVARGYVQTVWKIVPTSPPIIRSRTLSSNYLEYHCFFPE